MPKQIIWMGFAAYGIDRMFQRIIRDKLDHLTHQSSLQSESHKQNLPTSRAWEYDALPYCNHQHCKRRSRRSEGSAFFKTSARPLSGRRTFDQPLVEKPIDRYRKPKGLRLFTDKYPTVPPKRSPSPKSKIDDRNSHLELTGKLVSSFAFQSWPTSTPNSVWDDQGRFTPMLARRSTIWRLLNIPKSECYAKPIAPK